MIVITVGTTIAHLPNHLPELSRREARDIVEQCVQHARSFISHSRPDEEITRDRCELILWRYSQEAQPLTQSPQSSLLSGE